MPYWRVYLLALSDEWVLRMSSGLGVVLAAASFFFERQELRWLGLILAIVGLQIAAYRLWRAEYNRWKKQEEELRPRLSFEYRPGEKPYFERITGPSGSDQRWIRVGVHNIGGRVLEHVSVVLEKCEPDSSGFHKDHELLPQGRVPGTLDFMVAASDVVFVNVVVDETFDSWFEVLSRGGARPPSAAPAPLKVCYAQPIAAELDENVEAYRLGLRARSEVGRSTSCRLIVRPGLAFKDGDFEILPSEEVAHRQTGPNETRESEKAKRSEVIP